MNSCVYALIFVNSEPTPSKHILLQIHSFTRELLLIWAKKLTVPVAAVRILAGWLQSVISKVILITSPNEPPHHMKDLCAFVKYCQQKLMNH